MAWWRAPVTASFLGIEFETCPEAVFLDLFELQLESFQ